MPISTEVGSTERVNLAGMVRLVDESSVLVQAVATGTAVITIPAGTSIVRLSAAAATTGASLPVGVKDGDVIIIKISTAAANTVTFAAKATSNVAGGAATSLAGLAAHMFYWDGPDALWYQMGPLAN